MLDSKGEPEEDEKEEDKCVWKRFRGIYG